MTTGGTTTPWDGGLYAQNTAHHRAFDDQVLSGLEPAPDARLLDVGCGVGDLTARIAALVPAGLVVGIDPSASLLAVARQRNTLPQLVFRDGSAQQLSAVALEAPYDVVVSTAALHWVPGPDHPSFLAQARQALGPQGQLRVEFGGKGQIAVTTQLLDELSMEFGGTAAPWFFPSDAEYRPLLEAAGFTVRSCRLLRQRRSVPDRTALIGWLRSQVLIAYSTGFADPAAYPRFCAEAEDRAQQRLLRPDGSYDQDYVRLEVRATPTGPGPDQLFDDLSRRLRLAHRRVGGLAGPVEHKARLAKRLLAISDAAKHDLGRAAKRLEALEGELEAVNVPGPEG